MMNLLYGFLAFVLVSTTTGHTGGLYRQPEGLTENLRRLATANNDLALKVYRQLAVESSQSIFFSPLSLSAAFGMLYYGTRGQTAEELRRVLGYERADVKDKYVHQAFRQYLRESLPSQDTSAYVLNSANAIVVDKNFELVPSYRSDVQDLYKAWVRDFDFGVTPTRDMVTQINQWVRDNTNGKIESLLDDLSVETTLVLLNAVYFKGTWKTQFDPSETEPWLFHNYGQTDIAKVPMMRITEEFPYADTDDFQVLEMPYKGDNVSMVLLRPNELDGLGSIERSLDLDKLSDIRRLLVKTEVHVTIPKFKLEDSREMSREFKNIGAKRMFVPGPDFSGIVSNGNIRVDQVLHKAVVEVNEEGSEAAAVTGLISDRFGDDTPDFTLDRPFLFAIVDRRNDMILFMGRVTNL